MQALQADCFLLLLSHFVLMVSARDAARACSGEVMFALRLDVAIVARQLSYGGATTKQIV